MLIASIALITAACVWVTVTAVRPSAPLTAQPAKGETFESCRSGDQRRYRNRLADLQADRERCIIPPPFLKAAGAAVTIGMNGNIIR